MQVISFFFLSLGSTVFAEIQGVIDACIKLSGMPDLSLSFMVSFDLFYSSLYAWNIWNAKWYNCWNKILLMLYLCVCDLAEDSFQDVDPRSNSDPQAW